MSKNRFVHKEYGPCSYFRIVDGRLIPAIMPVSERADAGDESSSGKRSEQIAGGRILRVEFGKNRPDLIGPERNSDV